MKPSDVDLHYLEENSRFTKREILELYNDVESDTLTREQFNVLLDNSGVCDGPAGKYSKIRELLYSGADTNADGIVSMREAVDMLSKCALLPALP